MTKTTTVPLLESMENAAQPATRLALTIDVHDLGYDVNTKKGKKTILEGVSASFRPGQLTALMGPSGAGEL